MLSTKLRLFPDHRGGTAGGARQSSAKPRKNGVKRNGDDRQEDGHAEMTTTRTHFTFRVDTWTPDRESIVEDVAGVEDYPIALDAVMGPAPSER